MIKRKSIIILKTGKQSRRNSKQLQQLLNQPISRHFNKNSFQSTLSDNFNLMEGIEKYDQLRQEKAGGVTCLSNVVKGPKKSRFNDQNALIKLPKEQSTSDKIKKSLFGSYKSAVSSPLNLHSQNQAADQLLNKASNNNNKTKDQSMQSINLNNFKASPRNSTVRSSFLPSKQNSPRNTSQLQLQLASTKKTSPNFRFNKNFKKKMNKVQQNKTELNKTYDGQFHIHDDSKILSQVQAQSNVSPKTLIKNFSSLSRFHSIDNCCQQQCKCSFKRSKKLTNNYIKKRFTPQSYQEICKKMNEKHKKQHQIQTLDLQKRIKESLNRSVGSRSISISRSNFYHPTKILPPAIRHERRSCIDFNNPSKFNKISRFTLIQLKSYYNSLLSLSKGDPTKYKYAFEVMLNLSNVTVRESVIIDCIGKMTASLITFDRFLKTFIQIQDRLRKQTIIDFFEVLLQDLILVLNISYPALVATFQRKMKKSIANQLAELLYQKMGKDPSEPISKRDIQELCYDNEDFCNKFYSFNYFNLLTNKFENDKESKRTCN